MTAWIGAAIVAALVGSPHCLGMCGALACAASGRPSHVVGYHAGRIGTYAVLGAISGALGDVIPGPPWLGPGVAAVLLVGFAGSLAGWLPEPAAIPGLASVGVRLAARADLGSRVGFGVVNGLLPCGLVYSSLALAVAAADPIGGALVMTVFGLFTLPALLAATFGLRRVLGRSIAARRVLAAGVLVGGLGTLAFRAGVFTGSDGTDLPPCHRAALRP